MGYPRLLYALHNLILAGRSRLPFPLREGVGGWGIGCAPVTALNAADTEFAPSPLTPPRKGEGNCAPLSP